jgi:hypothetical protein
MVTIKVKDINNVPELMKVIKQYRKMKLRVGLFDPTNAYKAYIAEYGDPTNPVGPVPARPFMRMTVESLKNNSIFIDNLLSLNVNESLQSIGDIIVKKMRHQIDTAGSWAVPLSEYTKRKKGHSTILIETMEMYSRIEAVVI